MKGLEALYPSGDKNNKQLLSCFFIVFFLKFIWFDLCWCMMFTYRPFSAIETYLSALFFSCLFLMFLVCFRALKLTLGLSVLLDFLLLFNLMYSRTYYTAIPLDSYLIAGNLKDYSDSVFNSLRWVDIFFPLSTCVLMIVYWKNKEGEKEKTKNSYSMIGAYFLGLFAVAMLNMGLLWMKGGFKKAWESLQDSYTHTCGTPMYTLFGSICYDYIRDKEAYSPEIGQGIDTWLARQPDLKPVSFESIEYDGCIVILAESLESWVLETTVEGNEITPFLNRLLKDSTTIYAPHVLSQVKGGHSIDAQLIINTGLLPIHSGVYSLKFPYSYYPSLQRAMKEKLTQAKAYTLTVDKPVVWNQSVIVPQFGYDSLIAKQNFIHDELVGPSYRPQLGDGSFLRQCAEKIKSGEVWEVDRGTFLQCVTYSGHFPFSLPDHLKKISFSNKIPSWMSQYMIVANYTDRALGEFIEALRSDECFSRTLIVITGDHEGLGDLRSDLCASEAGKGVVSDKSFVPFIILNAPIGMRHEPVMGQIDIYPTLLQLLKLDNYFWKGVGQSILDPEKRGIAISSLGVILGDTAHVPQAEVQHLKAAWEISDQIIRYDYLKTYK